MLALLLGFLAAHFFFTPPSLTCTIAAPQDILALSIFLGRAAGTSQVLARLRQEAEEARRYAAEVVWLQEAATQAEVLRRTDALRAAVLSAVSHDLRTPLTTIKTAATNMLSTRLTWGETDRREMRETIVAQVDHINRLIGDLLAIGRIEAGKLRPQKELAAIGEVIHRVLERREPQLAAHPVSVTVPTNVPPVPVDVVEIDEILSNLLENAAKYTPAGTPIHIGTQHTGAAIAMQVSDDGPGIPTEHLPHLFDRYYRVHVGPTGRPFNFGGWTGCAIRRALKSRGSVREEGGYILASPESVRRVILPRLRRTPDF